MSRTILQFLLYFSLVLSVLFIIFYIYLQHFVYKSWKRQNVQWIKPEFPFGSMKQVMMKTKHMGELIKDWYLDSKSSRRRFVGAYLMHKPVLIPVDIKLIKRVLINDFNYFFNRGIYYNEQDDPLSTHLFSLEGSKWRNLRRKVSPTFSSGKLKQMFQTLLDCTGDLESCLDSSIINKEPIYIKDTLAKYTTNVIGSCVFGIKCNSFQDSETEFVKLGQQIFCPSSLELLKFFIGIILPSLARSFRMTLTNKRVDSFYRSLVLDTISFREENRVWRNDFMQLLIQLKDKGCLDVKDEEDNNNNNNNKLSLNELTGQAYLFFVAGFETSSTTMAFCLYELANNGRVQEKARKEVLEKCQGDVITYESLMEMEYLERIILGIFFLLSLLRINLDQFRFS